MAYSLVGSDVNSELGYSNDPFAVDLTYPGGIARGQLAIVSSIGFAMTAAPPGYTLFSPTGSYAYRVLRGNESGTITVNVDTLGSGGPTYRRQYAALIVLSEEPTSLYMGWDTSITSGTYSTLTGQTDIDEALHIAVVAHATGSADGDAGYSVIDSAAINWDAGLTEIAHVEGVTHGDPQADGDPSGTQSTSFMLEIATAPVTSDTIPASTNSITYTPPGASPGGPSTKYFIRSRQGPYAPLEEAYWGVLAGP